MFGPSAGTSLSPGRFGQVKEAIMDTTTLLIIVLVLFLLFGGGWYGRGRWY
jgi:hypothetical protein